MEKPSPQICSVKCSRHFFLHFEAEWLSFAIRRELLSQELACMYDVRRIDIPSRIILFDDDSCRAFLMDVELDETSSTETGPIMATLLDNGQGYVA